MKSKNWKKPYLNFFIMAKLPLKWIIIVACLTFSGLLFTNEKIITAWSGFWLWSWHHSHYDFSSRSALVIFLKVNFPQLPLIRILFIHHCEYGSEGNATPVGSFPRLKFVVWVIANTKKVDKFNCWLFCYCTLPIKHSFNFAS